jgi:predicted acyltransferase
MTDFNNASSSSLASANHPSRVLAIDALRGFDMFWIIGGDELARALGLWWGTPTALRLADQFEHAAWEGFRFYDLIFPLFLFVVGAVLPFSLGKYHAGPHPKIAALARITRRVGLLFLLGLVYNGLLQFDFPNLRITGVLQRIAICYGVASVIFLFTGPRVQLVLIAAILVGYWALLMGVPSPETGTAGDLTRETNLAGYVDRHYLPGKIYPAYYGFGDNEGLLSTIPAVATTLLGVLAGEWLKSNRVGPWAKSLGLLGAGLGCLGLGLFWSQVFPVIKILWTSSYVLIAAGWSFLLLGLFYALVDVLKIRLWARFFVVIGVNAITIYLASRIIPFDHMARFFFGGLARLSGDLGGVVLVLGGLTLEWLLLYHLDRQRIFLKV